MFADHDIVAPIPVVPEAIFGEFDWFLSGARYGRLLSKAMTSLFSMGVTGQPEEYYLAAIEQLEQELESWRLGDRRNGCVTMHLLVSKPFISHVPRLGRVATAMTS